MQTLTKRKFQSFQFRCSVISDLWLPCPSPITRACGKSCPSSRWCHPTISSSVIPFSSRLQSFPASGSFPMSQFFTSGGQSIGASATVEAHWKVMTFQWIFRTDFLYNWLVWSPCIPTLKSLFQHHSSKASILQRSAFFMVQLSYPYMISGKTIALSRRSFVGKVMSLLFNMLSSFVIVFLPRSKRLLISCMQLPFAVILEPKKVKSVTSHLCTMKWWDQMPLSSFFECWVLSQILRSPLTFIKRLFSFSLLSAIRVVSSVYLTLLIFLLVILIPAFASFSLAFHMTYSAYK